jgi:ribose transport system substrate-binding protein
MESGRRKREDMTMRFVKMLCAAALAAVVSSVPASAKDYKIGYSVFWGTNPFLVTMVNGAKKAAEEWKTKGVNVDIVVTNGGDTDKANRSPTSKTSLRRKSTAS